MNNGWLQFLIPKVSIVVDSLAEVDALRASNVKIYAMKQHDDGYLLTIANNQRQAYEAPVVASWSIYRLLVKFALPVAFLWVILLVAVTLFTVDVEIRGNLSDEAEKMVSELIKPHFLEFGSFAFFRSSNHELVADITKAFNDYTWIEVHATGSRLVVEIFDTKTFDNVVEKAQTTTLYARASGVVTKLDVTGCLVLVEVNQVVTVGEALVTCQIQTGDDEEAILIEGVAKGSVYADVWYEVMIEFPHEYVRQQFTSNSRSALFLNVFNRRFGLWNVGIGDDFEDAYERVSVFFNPLAIFNLDWVKLERVHYLEKDGIILTNETKMVQKRVPNLVKAELAKQGVTEFELVELQFLKIEEGDAVTRLFYHATVNEDIAN